MPDEIGTPAEGNAASTPAPEPTSAPANDYAPLMDRMSEIASSIDTRFSELEQRIPQAEAEPEQDPWAGLFGDEPEQEFEQSQQQPALDAQALQQAFNAALQQANAPLMAQIQQLQQERGREQLLRDIPQLQDPQVAQKTIEGMQTYLASAGAPPEVAAWLTNSPQAIAQYYKAAEADQNARAQVPASDAVPAVEAAAGAAPGGDGTQPDPIQAIHAGAWQLPPGLR